MRGFLVIVVLAASLGVSFSATAHIMLNYPPPRSNDDALRRGPCGNVPPTEPTIFATGETIEVRWRETIPHPGWFTITLSRDGDQTFEVLLDEIENPVRSGQHNHSQVIALPDEPCTNCTLQLVQIMLDYDPVENYYACADITLVAAGAGDELGADSGGAPDAGGRPDVSAPNDVDSTDDGVPVGADAGADSRAADTGPGPQQEPAAEGDRGCSVGGDRPASTAGFWLLLLCLGLALGRGPRSEGAAGQ